MSFPFFKLIVYQKSLEWVDKVHSILQTKEAKPFPQLANQLTRAAISISLNIAEGNGRWHKGDKRQFFWIARGSVFECLPLIEILRRRGVLTPQQHALHLQSLEEMAKMLTSLIASIEKIAQMPNQKP